MNDHLTPIQATALLPVLLIVLAFMVVVLAGQWRIFAKAGQPGWAAIIPVYRLYVMLKVSGKPGWWLLLLFIPLVNLVIIILARVGLAKNFGLDAGFAIGLILVPVIFFPILGFGGAQYVGNTAPLSPKT